MGAQWGRRCPRDTGDVTVYTVVAAVLVVMGLVGIVMPLLPGPLLVVGGIAVWAVPRHDTVGWTVLGVAIGFTALRAVEKYLLPGRRLGPPGCACGAWSLGWASGSSGSSSSR